MRRASWWLAWTVLAAALSAGAARSAPAVVNRINAIGLVDYSHGPTFKVGDWARYRVTGNAMLGTEDRYTITVLVAGEEDWWGEKCFWLETWTDYGSHKAPDRTASLISYAIFDDSLADQRLQLYRRKLISGVKEDGSPAEELTRPSDNLRTLRAPPAPASGTIVDTLPPDTVETPAGTFRTTRIALHKGTSVTRVDGDSTIYSESHENRVRYVSPDVPVTHCAREDIDNSLARRAWTIGHSSEGSALRTIEHKIGTSRLIAFGHGLRSVLLPPERQTPVGAAAPSAKQPAAKPKARPGAAARGH